MKNDFECHCQHKQQEREREENQNGTLTKKLKKRFTLKVGLGQEELQGIHHLVV